MTAMNLNSFFGGAELLSDLLIEHPRYDMSHHFTLACSKRVITPTQVFQLCPLHAGCAIEIYCALYSVQKILFTKWLGQKLGRTLFHRLDCHRDVATIVSRSSGW